LKNVQYIGDFAFSSSGVTKVTFGESLLELGENPFYDCDIVSFAKTEDEIFNGKVVGQTTIDTYAISQYVVVMDGVLYQLVPNGWELVSYPKSSTRTTYTVADDTVRISANAFADSALQSVTLPISLAAIGDKAFYGCNNLSMVVFTSLNAPVLEEEYDTSYATYSTMPISGNYVNNYGAYQGLGISKYYVWFIYNGDKVSYNNWYYGANFVSYIGTLQNKLVMVRPLNGVGYDTFILSQYFDCVVSGNNAPTDETLAVINKIKALPSTITLDSESAIVEARTAYDGLTSIEQQALVSNYSVLTEAEQKLVYLKNKGTTGGDGTEIKNEGETSAFLTFLHNNFVGLIIALVLLLAVAGLVTYILIDKKKNKR
jgi:hypothetical protein